jgi:N-acetylglucosaminyl-diphospho-decaprenol L-rhamnosyltransferase
LPEKDLEKKSKARRVATILVHYGDPGRTIRAVLNHRKLGIFSDIVVVANDLSQRPVELTEIPCTWLVPSRNLGYGGACQFGAMTHSADVYAFINAHVTIDKASVEYCIAAFDIKDVGVSAPSIYYPGRRIPAVDWKYAHCIRTYSRILGLPIQVPLDDGLVKAMTDQADLIDSDWATGGTAFCRDAVIRDIGWDGSYFLGYEDVDISMRAKAHGWRIVLVPSAIAFHSGRSTRKSAASAYYGMRNSLWFCRKYRTRRVQALLTAYLLLLLCRVTAADLIKSRQRRARPALRGLLHGWLLRPVSVEAFSEEPMWSSKG